MEKKSQRFSKFVNFFVVVVLFLLSRVKGRWMEYADLKQTGPLALKISSIVNSWDFLAILTLFEKIILLCQVRAYVREPSVNFPLKY